MKKNRINSDVLRKSKYDTEIVIEPKEDVQVEVKTGEHGELIIRTFPIETNYEYHRKDFALYKNPPTPPGYKYKCAEWNEGIVFEREYDKSEIVWVPAGALKPNGTLDGVNFREKFGARPFGEIEFERGKYKDPDTHEFISLIRSVKKYGGFFISRYEISINAKTGLPQSVKGKKPLVNVDFDKAKELASSFEKNPYINSHLPYGAEIDSIAEWFIESGSKTYEEVVRNSTSWGNYRQNAHSTRELVQTGSREEYCVNNIYDFTGNATTWTQEKYDGVYHTMRGGNYSNPGTYFSAIRRTFEKSGNRSETNGFRVALYLK